jgi:hypothetical protein
MGNKQPHYLVAYDCSIRYSVKNNPQFEHPKLAIKEGKKPSLVLEDIIALLIDESKQNGIVISNEGSGALLLREPNASNGGIPFEICSDGKTKRYALHPKAGRANQFFEVFDSSHPFSNPVSYSDKSVAAYDYDVFFYEDPNGRITAIFHKYGFSACKTLLFNSINDLLKKKHPGVVFDMDVIIDKAGSSLPSENIDPESLQLVTKGPAVSFDPDTEALIKEKTGKKEKIRLVRQEVSYINLKSERFSPLKKLFIDLRKKTLDPKQALVTLHQELAGRNFSDAKVLVRLGGKNKCLVSLAQFVDLVGEKEITDEIAFVGGKVDQISLIRASDNYFYEIFGKADVNA